MPEGPVTIGVVSEDDPAKGRIAAWEDRHRAAVTRGSLIALLLVAVVLFLVFRGGSGRQTCALYDHSSKTYLVIRAAGSSGEVRRDCRLLASKLSIAGVGRFSASTGSNNFGGEVRVCAAHGPQGEVDLYARRRTGSTLILCSLLDPTGGTATKVVKVILPRQPPVYLVLTGPSAATKLIAQRIVRQSSKKNRRSEVVPRPHGHKLCTLHRGPFSLSIYSSKKNASICAPFETVF